MSKEQDGGRAFPGQFEKLIGGQSIPISIWQEGMSLRAWLAGQALAGLAANITIREYPMETAARAVELADETLTTLTRPSSAGEIK